MCIELGLIRRVYPTDKQTNILILLIYMDKFNDCMEKNVNFVAKSSVTNTESNFKNDNVSTDKNIKISGEVGGKKNAVQLF